MWIRNEIHRRKDGGVTIQGEYITFTKDWQEAIGQSRRGIGWQERGVTAWQNGNGRPSR